MFYNTKIEALSGAMNRHIKEQQRNQKVYQLYQGDRLVFESVHLEEVEEEIDAMLCDFLEGQGIEFIGANFDDEARSNLQQYLNIRITC